MTTKLEIINMALSDCGLAPIVDIDDVTSAAARQAKAKYNLLRDTVLEAREWTFAKDRLLLAQDVNTPVFGYTYQYVIPSTVIRVCRCFQGQGGQDVTPPPLNDWVREGFRVLTNQASPVYAEVLQRVDEGAFSPGAAVSLSYRLTAAFAIPLTENRQIAADFWKAYNEQLIDAAANDGSQGRTARLLPPPLPGRQQNLGRGVLGT